MWLLRKLPLRRLLTILHDVVVTAIAIVAAFFLRFDIEGVLERREELLLLLPGFLIYAALVFHRFRLYRSKWRFASLPDIANILGASTVLALTPCRDRLCPGGAEFLAARFFFGKLTIVHLLADPDLPAGRPTHGLSLLPLTRTRRAARVADATPILVLGERRMRRCWCAPSKAVQSRRSGRSASCRLRPPTGSASIRGVAVLGGFDDLEDVVAQSAATRPAGGADHPDARGAGAAGASGENPDQGAAARPCDAAAAVAGGGQRSASAGGGACRGPAAAAERQNRLSAVGAVSRRKIDRRHRRGRAPSAPKSATAS